MRVDSEAMDSDEDSQQYEKDEPEKTKRQMKTPYQLETLEKAYLSDKYPTEAARKELSRKLGLTDRQLQMWYCHRRSKAKKEAAGSTSVTKPRTVGKRSEMESSSRDIEPVSSKRRRKMVRGIVACIEALMGEPLREDGPILGVEFDLLPPGAFGTPLDQSYDRQDSDEDRMERDSKRVKKELEKQEQLKRKMEEQMKREMEKQERDRKKEELRLLKEQQKKEEMEKREMERREKLMQKELLQAERKKQQDDIRREKELAKQKAAMERAEARRIAKEALELVEDDRLELMNLAARSKGLPSISSLDAEALQELESFRDSLCKFPPESVKLQKPFGDSEENVGNLLMVWKFCMSFADLLGLQSFTIDEFIQALHDDHDSRLLGKIHIALLKMNIKDIVDVVRSPTGGPGSNQYSIINPEGGHPQIAEGASVWGFDIRGWQKHLNSLTWPEILRQFALSAGFGPEIKKKRNENDEKGCEDIVSSLRNGSAAKNAVKAMKNKGVSLTPGTVKFAAYHVLAFEGSKGLNVVDLAEKIQEYGLRGSSTAKTISVALSRDPVLFERIAPSTYNVRPAYRKDPAEAETLLAEALDKVQRFANGALTGQNGDDEEADHDENSDCDVADLATPSDANKIVEDGTVTQEELGCGGESWVKGLAEGEYCGLSIEDRLNALVALVGIANQGNSMRVILEDRLDAACALKKQMLADAQLDKRHKNGSMAKDEEMKRALIGHRSEEKHVYRCAPLGSDRRHNRYWHFGCGGIFVESPEGFWSLIGNEEAFDALLNSLDTRGVRESHLHMMLQKIEIAFRDRDFSAKSGSLESSSTFKDLVQLVEQVEGGDDLSSSIETREDLLRFCDSVESLNQLPWIPRTTAAVALRILDSTTCGEEEEEEEQKPDIQQEYKLASSKRKREDASEVNGWKQSRSRTAVGKRRAEKSTPEEKPASPNFREVEDDSSSDDEEWGSGFSLAPCRTNRRNMVETSEEECESEDDNAAQHMDDDSDLEEEEYESEDDNVVEDNAVQHMDNDSDLEEEDEEDDEASDSGESGDDYSD